MPARISDPRTDPAGLEELEPLWSELHSHHRDVSAYRDLVEDLGASWERRRNWYGRLLADGALYLTAADDRGRLIGYAMLTLPEGPDDTFESGQGAAEVVTLVVADGQRGAGAGRGLLEAAERLVRERGFDLIKIAVMAGNARAQAFYERAGYSVAEHVLYRRLAGESGELGPPAP